MLAPARRQGVNLRPPALTPRQDARRARRSAEATSTFYSPDRGNVGRVTRRRRVSIEGYVALPAGVALRADAFGRSYWTRLSGFDVRLKLPRLDGRVVGGVVEPVIRSYGRLFLASVGGGYLVEWGFDRGSDDEGTRFAELKGVAVGIPLDGGDPRDALQSVLDGWGAWFAERRDWVEIYSDQDLDPGYSSTRTSAEGYFWTVGDRRPRLVAPRRYAITFDGRAGHLSPSAWKRLLRYVASGKRPPTERLLLRDAAAALSRRRYRQAVLDSGTLTELAQWELVLRAAGQQPSAIGPTDGL